MLLDDDLKPAPVRVLKLNGKFTPEATPDIVAKYSQPKRMTEQEMSYPQNFVGLASFPKKQDPDVPRLPIVPRPESAYRRAAAVRVYVPKPKPQGPGRDGWVNAKTGMTVEGIFDVQAQGLSLDQVAKKFHCTQAAVYKRLKIYECSSPEAAARVAALRVCSCGQQKIAFRATCFWCTRRPPSIRKAQPKRPDLTMDRILELQASGLSHRRIAIELRCSKGNISKRLRRHQRTELVAASGRP